MKALVLCGVILSVVARSASGATDPSTTFTRNCSSCHTFGHGVRVGPDLKGATDRHSREWLLAWISSSESVIRSGDPAAVALFDKFNHQRMPDQALTPGEIATLLDYLAAGGPDADARKRDRRAESATPAEIEMGRSLFTGERALAGGGASCFSCHRAREVAGIGGTLGPDLSSAYARYQDKGLSALLARGCFPRALPSGPAKLTEQEAFALKAFLRREMQVTR
jgi:mono/diheme cytochrome c family protein